MRRRILENICMVAALLLFAACSQEETVEQDTVLPEGAYPITISAMQAVMGEKPQTRVSDYDEGSEHKSKWTTGDKITVTVGKDGYTEETTCTLDENGKITEYSPQLYWQTTENYTINAWYSNIEGQATATENTVSLDNQTNGLAYMLKAEGITASYENKNIELKFHHQLAKVRVKLDGGKATAVTGVQVKGYTACTMTEGEVSGSNEGYITMCKNGDYYEANLVPMESVKDDDFIKLNGEVQAVISGVSKLEAGMIYTINITVLSTIPDDAKEITGDILDSGNYVVSGNRNEPVTVTDGSPNIYLDGANISVSSVSAINITGGNPTIHVVGANNTVSSSSGAGIYVSENSTVTITGRGRSDVLRVQAGDNATGIGGYEELGSSNHSSCGNITINNVTVYAYSATFTKISPGIGSNKSCGTITIDNATVYAWGTGAAMESNPAIGSYYSVPAITINGSDIYAYRGASFDGTSYADWIGRGGGENVYYGGAIQGDITSTTVHKGKWDSIGSETSEGTVVYDASGNATEQ